MANLRGGNFEKQVKDAFFRLIKFNEPKQGVEDYYTHSVNLGKKREMYLKDFKKFAEKHNLSGKLNIWMGDMEIMLEFFKTRTADLSRKTTKDYISGWNTMIKGLRKANICIDKGADRAIDIMLFKIKEIPINKEKIDDPIDRAISRKIELPLEQLIENIAAINPTCAILAQLQLETGFRTGEVFEVIKNASKYIQNTKITKVRGQGGQYYPQKIISIDLSEKTQNLNTKNMPIPSQIIYGDALKKAVNDDKIVPTDLRYTFITNKLEEKLAQNMNYEQAVKEVKQEACFYTKSKIWIQP